MATAKIEKEIAAIPEKKEKLRSAFEALRTRLSSSSFPISVPDWKDIDAHISSVEAAIRRDFEALRAKEATKPASATPPPSFAPYSKENPSAEEQPSAGPEHESAPRPELAALCANMDGKGLVSFIVNHRKDLESIRYELTPAIRSAPDPAKLVLDALDMFYFPSSAPKGDAVEKLTTRRTCITLLERLMTIEPNIRPPVREQALKLAREWKHNLIDEGSDNGMDVIGLVRLIVSYRLVSEFKVDGLLELLLLICRRKQAVHLCRSLSLTEYVPDLIEKLNHKGRQVDSVKFVYAFDLVEKFPPVPLLKAYIDETKKAAQDVRIKRNYSAESENIAISKQLGALKSVLKAVEEYNLENQYPRGELDKQIAELEKQKESKKRTSAAAAALKNAGAASRSKVQNQQKPNKRSRPSTTTSTPNTVAEQTFAPGRPLPGPHGMIPVHPSSYLHPAEAAGLIAPGEFYDHPMHYGGYPRVATIPPPHIPTQHPPSYGPYFYP
ncbi:truncated FRIGIDA-like protein 1 [Curcuma longa]|uniref:truncated FRIGIDA-like protein 1 n=1 Tax=Curcuma longa TaxID=136217 RepID=UPI003D9F2BC1